MKSPLCSFGSTVRLMVITLGGYFTTMVESLYWLNDVSSSDMSLSNTHFTDKLDQCSVTLDWTWVSAKVMCFEPVRTHTRFPGKGLTFAIWSCGGHSSAASLLQACRTDRPDNRLCRLCDPLMFLGTGGSAGQSPQSLCPPLASVTSAQPGPSPVCCLLPSDLSLPLHELRSTNC